MGWTPLILDMKDGAVKDFDRRASDIEGKVVMTSSVVRPKRAKRWIHRNEKYGRSLMAGAVGFVFVNHYPGYGPATGGVGHDGEGLIPAVSISKEDGAYLQRLIRRHGEVRIRLSSTVHNVNIRKQSRAPINPDLQGRLRAEFAPDVERLGKLLGRDLSHWSR